MWPFKKKQPKPKVFCINCKYMRPYNKNTPETTPNYYNCSNEFLVRKIYDGHTAVFGGPGKFIRTEFLSCDELNKNNDCYWFKQKEAPKCKN